MSFRMARVWMDSGTVKIYIQFPVVTLEAVHVLLLLHMKHPAILPVEEFSLLRANRCNFRRKIVISEALNYTWFKSLSFVYSRVMTSDSYRDVYKGMKNYFAIYFMYIF